MHRTRRWFGAMRPRKPDGLVGAPRRLGNRWFQEDPNRLLT